MLGIGQVLESDEGGWRKFVRIRAGLWPLDAVQYPGMSVIGPHLEQGGRTLESGDSGNA